MSSTRHPARPAAPAPPTAERIRDAAIAEFAAHGFTKSTVRAISTAAGVSPGLVIHHFGSKNGLRAACDDHVFEELTRVKSEHANASPLFVASRMFSDERTRTHVDYLLKSLLDPSAQGQRFFDHYVETIERVADEGFAGYTLRRAEDRRAQSTAIAMLALALPLLEPRIRHVLGTDDLESSMTRLAPTLMDLYRHGFIESVPHAQHAPEPGSNPGSPHDPPAPGDAQTGIPTSNEGRS
ncbi:TetR/AcrR family transcriptional regulator [Leucobacter triazinivorans]|uniref:TetR/AcrR family transcriptional regulator n=1 Tax=Leucobacter triazinivorans TaxID=1784719 RepID=A0A4P6KGV2_9MICO|nr:helix-turn-helix domain-containing protein [Leucobacter triazinivorans]QBE49228.1 TetR/AcrR family transcriptional regulator [Leucobacter triazinivorans]